MNDSDPSIELARNGGNQDVMGTSCPIQQINPNEVNDYLRDAARMLYDILRDYLKDQHFAAETDPTQSSAEAMPEVKERTS